MSDRPLVSVVIPAYNRADVIGRTLASVLAQTCQDFEIVIVDDASRDRDALLAAVARIGDPRIHVIHHDRNRFAAAARNTGVQNARGHFIAFLDSDDEWMPPKLQKQLALVDSDPSRDCVLHCAAEVLTTRSGRLHRSVMPLRGLEPGESITDYLFLSRGYLPTPSVMLPARLAVSHPMREDLRVHEDYELFVRLQRAGVGFLFSPDPLVRVHWEDVSASGRYFDPTVSVGFLSANRDCFSTRAASRFMLNQVVHPLVSRRRFSEAFRIFRQHVRARDLSLPDWMMLASRLVFGDARLVTWAAAVKNSRRG